MSFVHALAAAGLSSLALVLPSDGVAGDASATAYVCGGRAATIVGTVGADRIVGTRGDDVIVGLGGRDRLRGGHGDDVICGGPGPDRLWGGEGDDTLRGQASWDWLLGIAGNDRLYGGGDGVVRRSDGMRVQGDRLFPGPGSDYVDAGDDRRQGPLGNDRDRPDTVSFWSWKGGVEARLGDPGVAGVVRGPDGPDVIIGQRVVEIEGTKWDDTLIGGAGSERLLGVMGNDQLIGRGGDDELADGDRGRSDGRLSGGPGSDRIVSHTGADRITGGHGGDQVVFRQRINPSGMRTPCTEGRAGPGRDELAIVVWGEPAEFDAGAGRLRSAYHPGCDQLTGFESYVMSSDQSIFFIGTEAPEELRAINGFDGITATLKGGNDVVVGTNHDDLIDAGSGHDRVDGRGGSDTCVGAEEVAGCEATELPQETCDGQPVTIVASGTALPVLGTEGPDVILGSDQNDRIDGLGGDDVICALGGSDFVDGGVGNDRIRAGDDFLQDGSYLEGDFVKPGPGDDLVDLGFDVRRQSESFTSGRPDVLDYSASQTAIASEMTPDAGSFSVSGEGTDTIIAQPLVELWGSPHADAITGGPGDDRISGMAGDDILDGGEGNDSVSGEGNCSYHICGLGPPDRDVIHGGAGDDEVSSSLGLDELDGGDGDDFVAATQLHGARSMLGGPGEDVVSLDVRGSMDVYVDGGLGADWLVVEGRNPLPSGSRILVDTVRERLVSHDVTATATVLGFESFRLVAFIGTDRALRFQFLGSDAPEIVHVFPSGRPSLRAWTRGGDDLVRGSEQDDLVDGGSGFDRVRMLGGDDRCIDVEIARGCEQLHRATR